MGLIGSPEAVAIIGVGAALGVALLVQRPWKRAGLTVVAISIVPVVAVAIAWLISRQESVWQPRYLTVVLAPIAVVLAVGLARGGRIAMACLVVYGLLTAPIGVKQLPTQKSNVALVADHFAPALKPGDLVVSDFGRVPLLSYYMPPGLRYAEAPGLVPDPRRTNQRDGTLRLRAADQRVTLLPLVESLPVGGQVLVICPPISNLTFDDTEFVQLIHKRCTEAETLLAATPGLRLVDKLDINKSLPTLHVSVQGHLYLKEA